MRHATNHTTFVVMAGDLNLNVSKNAAAESLARAGFANAGRGGTDAYHAIAASLRSGSLNRLGMRAGSNSNRQRAGTQSHQASDHYPISFNLRRAKSA